MSETRSPQSIDVPSPAKVNWILRVGAKRDDGFHGVETAMLALSLQDSLRISVDETLAPYDLQIELKGPAASADIPTDGRNLIAQALDALPDRARTAIGNLPGGLRVELTKRIPSQAGLGGGSSNAAAALAGTFALAGLPDDASLWLPGLEAIGSDCPFFGHVLMGDLGPAGWFADRGQRLVGPLEEARELQSISVLTPHVVCPTGAIYAALAQERSTGPSRRATESMAIPQDWIEYRANDLQDAALGAQPKLLPFWTALEEVAEGAFQLCGSGASFYAPIPQGTDPEAWHKGIVASLAKLGHDLRFAWCGPLFAANQ